MLVGKLETAMSDSLARVARRKHLSVSGILGSRNGPPTPSQRRLGTRLAIGIIVAALLAIVLLDHYGILH